MKRLVLSNDAVPVEKQVWQVRESEDQSDPTDHESFIRHEIKNIGLLISASIRGKNHEHQGKWREDAFCVHVTEYSTIMAVADGAGSCPLSRVGAVIACQTAVNSLKESLSDKSSLNISRHNVGVSPCAYPCSQGNHRGLPLQNTEKIMNGYLKACLRDAVLQSVSAIEQEAFRRKIPKSYLSTTLMLAVYAKIGKTHRIGALQIGDGVMCIRLLSDEIRVLGKSDYGEYGGQSLFLTDDIVNHIEHKIVLSESESLKSFAMLTDGISDDFFPSDKGLMRFFNETDAALSSQDTSEAIKRWIRYEKTGSYDDRTMILLSLL